MVFSSLEFIYLFLPPVLVGYIALRAWGRENLIIWWLIAASLAFYAWWSPLHLLLLIGSVIANFALHKVILRRDDRKAPSPLASPAIWRRWLTSSTPTF